MKHLQQQALNSRHIYNSELDYGHFFKQASEKQRWIYSNTKNIHSQQLFFTYYNNRAVLYMSWNFQKHLPTVL
jgi:hypothetical protein